MYKEHAHTDVGVGQAAQMRSVSLSRFIKKVHQTNVATEGASRHKSHTPFEMSRE
jgi:hypothetical protein